MSEEKTNAINSLKTLLQVVKSKGIWSDICITEEDVYWLIFFFSDHWPDHVPCPRMNLGRLNRIDCEWGDDTTIWGIQAFIDPKERYIHGFCQMKTNPIISVNFFLHLDDEEERGKLFSILKVLEERILTEEKEGEGWKEDEE